MGKRPSLAETMRQVTVSPEPQPVKPASVRLIPDGASSPSQETPAVSTVRPYFAATRVGKKKVTAALSPAAHKQLKGLAVEQETKSETLLVEAIRDLFAKYGKVPID